MKTALLIFDQPSLDYLFTIINKHSLDIYSNHPVDNLTIHNPKTFTTHCHQYSKIVVHNAPAHYLKYYGVYDKMCLLSEVTPAYFAQNTHPNPKPIIPKIIHFMWLSNDNSPVPNKYESNINRWKELHPDYKIKFWNNDKVSKLLTVYPQYASTYNNCGLIISKCDFSRMLILYHYGGWYFDLDFYAKKSLNSLQAEIILVREIAEQEVWGPKLYNGALGCIKKYEFIKGWIDQMVTNLQSGDVLHKVQSVTGPLAFMKYYQGCLFKPVLTNSCYLLPYSGSGFQNKHCKNIEPVAYTLWTEGSEWSSSCNYMSSVAGEYWWIVVLILIVLVLILVYTS